MTNYTELERLAYISGQPGLADLYDKAAELEGIDLDSIQNEHHQNGYEQGKRDASDDELLQEIAGLKARVKTLDDACTAMYNSYAYFLNWLDGSEARLAANRKQAIRNQKSNLLRWRSP